MACNSTDLWPLTTTCHFTPYHTTVTHWIVNYFLQVRTFFKCPLLLLCHIHTWTCPCWPSMLVHKVPLPALRTIFSSSRQVHSMIIASAHTNHAILTLGGQTGFLAKRKWVIQGNIQTARTNACGSWQQVLTSAPPPTPTHPSLHTLFQELILGATN